MGSNLEFEGKDIPTLVQAVLNNTSSDLSPIDRVKGYLPEASIAVKNAIILELGHKEDCGNLGVLPRSTEDFNEWQNRVNSIYREVNMKTKNSNLELTILSNFFDLARNSVDIFKYDYKIENVMNNSDWGPTSTDIKNVLSDDQIGRITQIPGSCLCIVVSKEKGDQNIFIGQTPNSKMIAIKLLEKDLVNLKRYKGNKEHPLMLESAQREVEELSSENGMKMGDLIAEAAGVDTLKRRRLKEDSSNLWAHTNIGEERHFGALTREVTGGFPLTYYDTGRPDSLKRIEEFVRVLCAKKN